MTARTYVVALDQVRRYRLLRSGLITPFATPEAAASALAGVQAQIHFSFTINFVAKTDSGVG